MKTKEEILEQYPYHYTDNDDMTDTYVSLENALKAMEAYASQRDTEPKKGEYFRKVYIKSEADLPDKTGYYVVWLKNNMNMMSVKWYVEHDKSTWDDVVSYLSLLPEPVSNGSAEEIDRLINWLKARYPIEDITVDAVKFIMQEFASQSHKEVTLPSDEDIDREFPINLNPKSIYNIDCNNEALCKRSGAKWLKSQIKG